MPRSFFDWHCTPIMQICAACAVWAIEIIVIMCDVVSVCEWNIWNFGAPVSNVEHFVYFVDHKRQYHWESRRLSISLSMCVWIKLKRSFYNRKFIWTHEHSIQPASHGFCFLPNTRCVCAPRARAECKLIFWNHNFDASEWIECVRACVRVLL